MGPFNVRNLEAAKIAAAVILIAALKEKQKPNRRLWARNWLLRRRRQGCYENLMRELKFEDPEGYRRYLRLTTDNFEVLLAMVSEKIQKKDTLMRETISAGERLSVTLRYLATGETQSSLQFIFRIARNTISGIIPEVCKAVLEEEYLQVPSSGREWDSVARRFFDRWNFPNCIGALDGKHVKILPPKKAGSLYYNYKGDHSIVLLALVDADLKFLYIDVGTNGRISDGGVWGKSSLKKAIENDSLNIPHGHVLPKTKLKLPYVLVADDAFPLSPYIMKPHTGTELSEDKFLFNYRLSRARRCVENAFGLLAARFQVFKGRILTSPAKAVKITQAACCLHNFLLKHGKNYSGGGVIDVEDIKNRRVIRGTWRDFSKGLIAFRKGNYRAAHYSKQIQKLFTKYCNSVGKVTFQYDMARLQ